MKATRAMWARQSLRAEWARQPLLPQRPARRLVAASLLAVAIAACSSDDHQPPPVDLGVSDIVAQIEFSQDDLLAACVRLGACGIQLQPRIGDCVKNFYTRLAVYGQRVLWELLYACANEAKGDCGAIHKCLGFAKRPTDPKLKCDSTFEPSCDGNIAQKCDLLLYWEQKLDCAKGGLKCGVKDTGSSKDAICGGGSCASGTDSVCKDWKLYACNGGAIEVNDCPEQGLQCRDGVAATCEGTGRSCQSGTDTTCKGNVLAKCESSYLTNIDCSKLPGKKRCDATSKACVPAGTACSSDAFDSCASDDNTLVSCIDGEVKKFDCQKLGFLSCKAASTYGALCEAAPIYDDQ
jgi:hypothetical protein